MGWAGNVNLCFGDFKFITYAKPNGTSNEYIRMIQEPMNGAWFQSQTVVFSLKNALSRELASFCYCYPEFVITVSNTLVFFSEEFKD